MAKAKGMSEKADRAMDKRMGMRENGPADKKMDRKMGVKPPKGKKGY